MNKNYFLSVCLASLLAVSISHAADKSSGCGLGWKVTKKNGLLSSTTRAYTNFTFSNSFAMTSGTSGCAKHSFAKKEMESLYFAEANFHNLMIEMAEGRGQFLDAFAATLGCNEASFESFGSMTQSQYNAIFASEETTPYDMLKNVRAQLRESDELSAQCSAAV